MININFCIDWQNAYRDMAAFPKSVLNLLPLAKDIYCKVLIHAILSGETETDKIAASLNITPETAEDAISFWIASAVFKSVDSINETHPKVSCEATKTLSSVLSPLSSVRETDRATRPKSPKEIEKAVGLSDDLGFLLKRAEDITGSILNFTTQAALVHIFENFCLSGEIILMALGYLNNIERFSPHSLEKMCRNWSERGITTHNAAENELKRLERLSTLEGQVMSRFKLGRALSTKERRSIEEWESYGFDIEIIMYAFDEAVDHTGKAPLPYIAKCLKSWHEKGFKTLEQIEESGVDYKKTKKKKETAEKMRTFDFTDSYDEDIKAMEEQALALGL
ncbi:MAG: DnaD domain protein [Ruminococcus sp.]|nr:DnaD domain protein [Ruminococcus sp.]